MKLYSIPGNTQKLDGGAMFGNAPKALWQRWTDADRHNRIDLACRALLVDTGPRKILFDAGIGTFFPPELRERYGVQEERPVLLESLGKFDFDPEQITDVVISHLHFDHAGGLLSSYRAEAEPSLVFPRARYYVSRSAFERACRPHLRDRASFIPELQGLLEGSGGLQLIDDPRNHTLAPTVRFRFSDGHTPGLMISEIRGARRKVMFVSDLIPGTPWVHLPITMGYDRFPELLIEEKRRLLEECREHGAFLFFTHDPETALAHVTTDEKGRYRSAGELPSLEGWEI